MKKYFLPIGYFISFMDFKPKDCLEEAVMPNGTYDASKLTYGLNSIYCIEKDDSIIALNMLEIGMWLRILVSISNFEEKLEYVNDEDIINTLIIKGVLVAGDTMSEVVKQIGNLKPIRQGSGFFDGQGFYVGLEKGYRVNTTSKIIWEQSNGKISITEIWNGFFNNSGEFGISIEEYYKNIAYLLFKNLLFLR